MTWHHASRFRLFPAAAPQQSACLQAHADLGIMQKERFLAESRAGSSEQSHKVAQTQLRSIHSRLTALESQLHLKESELEEAEFAIQDARTSQHASEHALTQVQAEARKTSCQVAALTAQLGVQTALCQSKDVEMEELKAAVERRALEGEASVEALVDTTDEVKRLRGEIGRLQGSLKMQARGFTCCRALCARLACIPG
jgi:chromosome segregation ATPase